jgi:hypothetical protein
MSPNSQLALSNWVNTTPNPKMLQSMCNWNNHPHMGHFKTGAGVSLAFNY